MLPERGVESLAVCMPQMDKQCANFYVMDLSLNAERQSLGCAWAFTKNHLVYMCSKTSASVSVAVKLMLSRPVSMHFKGRVGNERTDAFVNQCS